MIRSVVVGAVLLATATSATADGGATLATSVHVGAIVGPVSWDGMNASRPDHFEDTIAGVVVVGRLAEGVAVGSGISIGVGMELAFVKGLTDAVLDQTTVSSPAQVGLTARISQRVTDRVVFRAGLGVAFGSFRDSGPNETTVSPEIAIGPILDVSLTWQTSSAPAVGAELQVGYLTDREIIHSGSVTYVPVTLCFTAHWGRW